MLLVGLVLAGCAEMVVAELAMHAASSVSKAVSSNSKKSSNTSTSSSVSKTAKSYNGPTSNEIKRLNADCENGNLSVCTANELCGWATYVTYGCNHVSTRHWSPWSKRMAHVNAAKSKGLSCGVTEAYQQQELNTGA